MPLYVASKLSKMRPSSFTASPSQYARSVGFRFIDIALWAAASLAGLHQNPLTVSFYPTLAPCLNITRCPDLACSRLLVSFLMPSPGNRSSSFCRLLPPHPVKRTLLSPAMLPPVLQAVATIGYDKRTFGYIPHMMQMWVLANFPWSIIKKVLWGMHMSIRNRALKKKAGGQTAKTK